ncbi:toprim domain-containing protein [Dehalobacter sp. 14DCB1]|uniref:toprim domain-containing protein n=1 Tax=Dehalobacter sp. 14DCB1 TaxID=2070227 RepID=UPI0010539013|nr:toprim domain-containing protein [Dehalobacter sp. 14DCB1]TCX53804.1 hypothetical protein C1I36_03475 [Dehalobacter sp. 14DCB1]
MDAVTLINAKLDVMKLLRHYNFDHIKEDGQFIRSSCRIHRGNNPTAFVINQETGLWFCHTNCGGGDIYTLVQKMENIDFFSAVRWLSSFYDVDITNAAIIDRKENYLEDIKKFIQIVKRKKVTTFSEFTICEEIREVMKFRQFEKQTIDHFRLGYVDCVSLTKKTGEIYVLNHRLIFPIIFNGIQIGISFRRVKSTDVPKWSHQPAHLEMGNVLYNYDDASSSSEIIVCEGITDVWAFYEIGLSAVATFGTHITDIQYKLLMKTGADIVLAYDGDHAGHIITEKAIKQFKNKANLSVITFDEGTDPESIERKELLLKYENRKKIW